MKKILSITAAILLTSAASVNAETELFGGKVKAGGYLAQHWQSEISVDGSNILRAADANADSGFQRLRVGLWFSAELNDTVGGYIEIADEPNDYGGNSFSINQDLAWIHFNFNEDVTLRVGNIVETTMNFLRYSDGAAVQGNPLIGNGINDMITATHGLWLLGAHDTGIGKWDWNLTVSSPSFAEDFSDESGYNYGARTTLTTDSGFAFGAGIFLMDGDVVSCPTNTTCTLGSGGGQRSLVPVGDGDHYHVGQQAQNSRTQVAGILPGIDGHIWQIDLMWSGDQLGVPVTIHGFYGQGEDEFSHVGGSFAANAGNVFSTVDSEQSFWGLFGRVDLNDNFYLASRYGVSINDTAGVTNGDEATRIQVGAGYWMNDSTLIKAEYVSQEEEAGSGGGSCNPAGTGDCEWDGFVVEASISF